MFGQSGSYSVVSRPRNQVRYPSGLGQPLTRFPARRAKMVRMIFGSFPANFPLYLPLGLIQTTAYRGVSAAEEIVLFARGGLLRWRQLSGRRRSREEADDVDPANTRSVKRERRKGSVGVSSSETLV
ncbi:hypothetical protein RRG08_029968 [Elysia crispata]|uniref:Uncharacterized protein n=1 Tax=Elysia crispata TaxID=231223 RepID=A0AAE0ZJ84_9GAST|nr:hypothetical protein RRG08_029968 [Elysia crispata]